MNFPYSLDLLLKNNFPTQKMAASQLYTMFMWNDTHPIQNGFDESLNRLPWPPTPLSKVWHKIDDVNEA